MHDIWIAGCDTQESAHRGVSAYKANTGSTITSAAWTHFGIFCVQIVRFDEPLSRKSLDIDDRWWMRRNSFLE